MNGPRVVPLLAALWLAPFAPAQLRRMWDRLRRALGLVHEPCDRLHADDVEIVVEGLNPAGVWLTLERLTLFERHLLEKFSPPSDAPYLYPGVRVRAYGPGHVERDRPPARPAPGFENAREPLERRVRHG